MINILLIGNCGVGKTHTMKQIIQSQKNMNPSAFGLFKYIGNDDLRIAGVYDGSMFEGTDKLAMDVMRVMEDYILGQRDRKGINIFEGDRFMNKKFIAMANPFVIKIKGDGKAGREQRGSQQTQRHLKSINTRVHNIEEDFAFDNSDKAVEFLTNNISLGYSRIYAECEVARLEHQPQQAKLF
jgi:hypothetical protein